MNTHNTSFIAVLMALILLPACSRMEKAPADGSRIGISFAAPLQTKATDAVATSDIFQVRDWYNGGSYYIDNTLKWDSGNSTWGYGTTPSPYYEWKGGSHLFFSWLQSDDSYSTTAFFGTGLSASGNTLTLPAKTLNTSVAQYDFLYSNPVYRSTADNDYSDIPLIFNHLFAQVAISFQISNQTPDGEQPIYLTSVSLNNTFKNQKATTIEFNEDGTADVNFTTAAADGVFIAPHDWGGMSYGKGATPIDVLSQRQVNTKDFYYFWPASEAELHDVIDVVYQISGETDPVSGDPVIRTSRLSFPKGTSWKGGHKYSYTITYMGGIFKVEETVLDWNYTSLAAPAEDQSVMASWMGWDSSTCTVSGRNITFKTYPDGGPNAGKLMPIHGMFKIFSPTQCTYHINLSQNAEKYTITPNDGTHTSIGSGSIGTSSGDINPGVTIDFYISARDEDRPAAGQPNITADLSFSVQASGGREYSLDSEIQRDGAYTIIIPSM